MPQDEPAIPIWRSRTIETAGFALSEQETGGGAPVLCLGFEDPEGSRLLDDLSRGFRLIALSPAAVPLSDTAGLDAHAFAQEALACADRLGLDRFCVLARGDEDHAALCLALKAPERVEAVALLAPDLHSRDGAAEDAELLEHLADVVTPVLAAFGALDRIVTPQTARAWRERLHAGRIVFVPDASRDVDIERPHATARLIGDFLLGPRDFTPRKNASA